MDLPSPPYLDHAGVDLDAAARVGYRIEQSFTYSYAVPVADLAQRLVVVPRRRHGALRRRGHTVQVFGAAHARRTRDDAGGNTIVRVHAPRVESAVEFRLTAVVTRVAADGPPVLPATTVRDPRLLRPTRLTAPDDRLRDAAAGLSGAEEICRAVQRTVAYIRGVTGVRTTAAEAFAGGAGVCQDQAHVMLALCRLRGLPARYVSGHLLGQGGTHAWVEVVEPRGDHAVATAWDPCHGRRVDASYVTVAVGRDYADVAPVSGSYTGPPGGTLTGTRRVGVISLDD